MRKGFITYQALSLPLLAAGLWASASAPRTIQSSASRAASHPACAVWIDGVIPLSVDRARIIVKYSEPIGDQLSGSLPDDAKTDVMSVKHEADNAPLTATMVVNTMRSVAGQWELSVRGETGRCTGKVWIGQGNPKGPKG